MGGDHADRGRGPSDAMGRTAEDARRDFGGSGSGGKTGGVFGLGGGREVRAKTETADR